jgi:thiol-disulfide isomerase/thioredoxin
MHTMKNMKLSIVALAMMLLAVACSGGASESGTQPSEPAETIYDFNISLYQGSEALGSETVAVSDLRGKPAVLNFWAGLCPPCRAEMPEFQAFANEYDGRAVLVGVDLGQFFALGSEADAIALLGELGVTYPAGSTDDGNLVRQLGVLGLPATFFVAADGSLHRKWQGVLNGEKLAEITDEMLAQ